MVTARALEEVNGKQPHLFSRLHLIRKSKWKTLRIKKVNGIIWFSKNLGFILKGQGIFYAGNKEKFMRKVPGIVFHPVIKSQFQFQILKRGIY